VGFSDTPAWRVAQAQTLAALRSWSPLIAVQFEYSLAERTVETELVPMALELGLGVTPWGPLKSGMLTGKYTRADAASAKPDRGHFVTSAFNERVFAIVDEINRIAGELGTTAGKVALAWLLGRPGVASVIVGARSLAQLEDNLGAGAIALPADAVASLDQVSAPPPQWISMFDALGPMQMHGGMKVNDLESPLFPLAPKPGDRVY
jgi:aryl-alcohol dehydrogenase-like predicted oxidoreductase